MILICLAAASAALAGCGDEGGSGVAVVATTAVAADVVRQVAGPEVEVDRLLPEGASPHDFGAGAKDRARLEEADLVVAWGGGIETGIPLDDLDPGPLELAAGEDDPHLWMDPLAVAERLPPIADALGRADPDNAAAYRRRAAAFARRLGRLDRRIRRILAAVPDERRKLVTAHDSLGHFARRYDFEVVGAAFGRSPEAEPSADSVAELIERVERERVPAVFADDASDPELVEEIAREAGVRVVDDLLVEGFGGRVDSYKQMLLFDARRIAEVLAR